MALAYIAAFVTYRLALAGSLIWAAPLLSRPL
jgi:hypothetical protein